MQFTQSGLGQRAFQAQKPCKNGIVSIDQILKQKILSAFKIDENTHQSVIIYSSEADAQEENARRQEMRKQTIKETGHSMVEETMGPILSIMSEA